MSSLHFSERTQQRWCPFCRDHLDLLPTSSCAGCATQFHALCHAELGRCSTFGCPEAPYPATQPEDGYRLRHLLAGLTCVAGGAAWAFFFMSQAKATISSLDWTLLFGVTFLLGAALATLPACVVLGIGERVEPLLERLRSGSSREEMRLPPAVAEGRRKH